MDNILQTAISSVRKSQAAFCHFITPNDVGATGAHQSGFTIPTATASIFFDSPGQKGEIKDHFVKVRWQGDFTTDSRAVYYGQKSRNEYRLTRFGKGFPFLKEDKVGSLLVVAQHSKDDYDAFVFETEDDIDSFMSVFNLSFEQNNKFIDMTGNHAADKSFEQAIAKFVQGCLSFPDTKAMSAFARKAYAVAFGPVDAVNAPDDLLPKWLTAEYHLFRSIEQKLNADILARPFASMADFVARANSVLNARKARAGKSLEHHLAAIFTANGLAFEEQVVTEKKKRPDFVFPNGRCYHHFEFPSDKLTILGAKTTCRDRWSQVAYEAARADFKYLFTTQPGISADNLKELGMLKVGVVTPRQNIESFPKPFQDKIWTLAKFVAMVREQQAAIPRQFAKLLSV